MCARRLAVFKPDVIASPQNGSVLPGLALSLPCDTAGLPRVVCRRIEIAAILTRLIQIANSGSRSDLGIKAGRVVEIGADKCIGWPGVAVVAYLATNVDGLGRNHAVARLSKIAIRSTATSKVPSKVPSRIAAKTASGSATKSCRSSNVLELCKTGNAAQEDQRHAKPNPIQAPIQRCALRASRMYAMCRGALPRGGSVHGCLVGLGSVVHEELKIRNGAGVERPGRWRALARRAHVGRASGVGAVHAGRFSPRRGSRQPSGIRSRPSW